MKEAVFTILVLALVAASQASFMGDWKLEPGLSVKFDVLGLPGMNYFYRVPRNLKQAKNEKWVEKEVPKDLPDLYKEFTLLCYEVCHLNALYDKHSGYIVGLLIGLPKDGFSNNLYDMESNGFGTWTVDIDGEPKDYWYTYQMYIKEFIKKSSEERIASYNTSKILQDGVLTLVGLKRQLTEISEDVTEMKTNTLMKQQACIAFMGTHYYYNMSKTTEKETPLFPWFTLVHGDNGKTQSLIGASFMVLGKLEIPKKVRNHFETPPKIVVQSIINDGPEWLYEEVDKRGVVTCHIYFVDSPNLIMC